MHHSSSSPSSPVRVGLAGLGRAGWGLHADTLAGMRDRFEVVAVTDAEPDRSAEAAARFGCARHPRFADLAAAGDVELVVVATPSHLHASHAVEALDNGKHVLVEKPAATSLADLDRMLAAARRAGRLLIGSQNLRYTGDFLAVRGVVESGKLGPLIEIKITWHAYRRRWDWQTLRSHGGGALNNDASHIVDQALQLLGDVEPEVSCRLVRTPLCLGDTEDHVKITLTAPGSPMVDIEVSNGCAYPQDRWLVLGVNGTLTGNPTGLRWRYLDPRSLTERVVHPGPPTGRAYDSEELAWTEETCDLATERYTESHLRMYTDLYGTLREGRPVPITPADLRRQVAVLDACRAAADRPKAACS